VTGRLAGKTAVVTGGGNGIGRACVELFAAEGACVVVADLLPQPGREAAETVVDAGGAAVFVELDVANAAANRDLASTAVEEFGSIDVVVTAAGINYAGYVSSDLDAHVEEMATRLEDRAANPAAPITELDIDAWRRVLDVNLTGTLLTMQATASVMVEQQRPGSIVTIASIAAADPLLGAPSYPVSKAGVWMLTKSAARTLAPLGIRVNAIGPGFIATNMTAVTDVVEPVGSWILANTPMGRKGTPEEVANVALFLASDDASYVTGELIHPDGGWFTG
jgi:NAD(P)-dependent dehydrogenase (short-subunit alcohol dehydrogenase family)